MAQNLIYNHRKAIFDIVILVEETEKTINYA